MRQVLQKDKRDVQLSKALSYLLRHAAVKEKLTIDSNGYTPLKELLSHNRLKTHKCTVDDIHRIVKENDKQRFHLKNIRSGRRMDLCYSGTFNQIDSAIR